MNDYKKVSDAMKGGADPAMLCATCPWDRYCITPPSMTSAEVEEQLEDARLKDEQSAAKAKAEGRDGGLPMTTLMMSLAVGSSDRQATVCPVFAARLRSSDGRSIVDGMKAQMKAWDDGEVGRAEGIGGE